MARAYFLAYHSYLAAIEPLSEAERGRLFTACLCYSMAGEAPELRGNERFVWPAIQSQIDRDRQSYDERCAANRGNAIRRYATASDGVPDAANPEKEKAKEKEKGKTKKSENENENEKTSETANANENANAKEPSPAGSKKAAPLAGGMRDAMERFQEHRKRLHAPMTKDAVSLLLARLEALGGESEADKIALLDQSIERGWKGVYPLSGDSPAGRERARHGSQRSYTDDQLAHLFVDLDGPTPGEAGGGPEGSETTGAFVGAAANAMDPGNRETN